MEFPAGDDVGPAAQAGQQAQDSQVGVGLHRETDDMRKTPEGGLEDPVVVPQGGGAIQIKRRPHLLGDFTHRDVFAVEFACLVVEMMHQLKPLAVSFQLSAVS